MTFLSPLLLFAAAALAVPLLLHFLRRSEAEATPFPALRYLRSGSERQLRNIRLRRRVLLALRLSAVALLVLAAARPVLPLGGTDYPPAGLVIVVDNGIASGIVIGEARLLDRFIAAGREALLRTGPRDRIWVIAAGEPWRPAPSGDAHRAGEALEALTPSHVTPDFPAALRRARALLQRSGLPVREILLLLTDPGLSVEGLAAGPDPVPELETVRILILDPGVELPPNRGIGALRIGAGLPPRAGDPFEIEATIVGEAVGGLAVRLFVGDRLAAVAETDSTGRAIMHSPASPVGWVEGRVELEADALRADDVRHFAFRVIPPPRVDPGSAAPAHLEAALQVLADAGRMELTRGGVGAEVGFLPQGERTSATPGVLVAIAPSDAARLPALNAALSSLGVEWRLGPETRSGGRALRHPGSDEDLPGSPLVFRHHPFLPPSNPDGSRVLLALADGSPWLVEVPREEGILLLLASALVPEATTLPVSAAMIPLVEMLTAPLGARGAIAELPAGTPLPLPPGAHTLRAPDGTTRALAGISHFSETGLAGLHRILDSDGEILHIRAVNPHPVILAGARDPAAVAVSPDRLGAELLSGRRGREVPAALLAAAFLLLLAEGWVASVGGGRTPAAAPDRPA